MRTPPGGSLDRVGLRTQSSVTKQANLTNFFSPAATKRPRSDIPCDNETDNMSVGESSTSTIADDPLRAIMMMMERNQTENRSALGGIATQMNNLHGVVTKIESNIETIGSRVGVLESTVGKTSEDVSILKRKMEELEQDKLETHMLINGIESAQIEANKNDPKTLALNLIRSFNINLNDSEIEQAFITAAGQNKRRVVVIFRSAVTKRATMTAKRACKDERKIYFDHRVTATVGEILRQLRMFAKVQGGRAFLYGGRACYQKDPNPRVRINALEDIDSLNNLPQ